MVCQHMFERIFSTHKDIPLVNVNYTLLAIKYFMLRSVHAYCVKLL